MLFFVSIAIASYKLMKWNISVRREKEMDEVSTKGNIIKYWIMIVCFIICAFICFFKLIFDI
jgi:hypothetical protein